jgi:glycosyltransferase involved in cell wall biosynthesis
VPEVVLDNVTGLITSLDIQEIADALEKLVRDKALRARLGIAAFQFTLANFGVQRLIQDHEVLYKELLFSPTKF